MGKSNKSNENIAVVDYNPKLNKKQKGILKPDGYVYFSDGKAYRPTVVMKKV